MPDIVLRVEDGRYVWWHALQMVEFIPKRKRRGIPYLLTSPQNTRAGATAKAERLEKSRSRG